MSKEVEIVERPCSVEISINGKGQWSGKVKAYDKTAEEALLSAENVANNLQEILDEKNDSS